MIVARGILTSQGGTGSHAAVVARGAGLPAVVGCEAIRVDYEQRQFEVRGSGVVVREGDEIAIDGTTGTVYKGSIRTAEPNFEEDHDLRTRLGWPDPPPRPAVWAHPTYPPAPQP